MSVNSHRIQVFISHSTSDTWVAQQIAGHVQRCGAGTFLDQANIQHGDDFENEILKAADDCNELLVLLTPWSVNRPYVWLEIGVFWGNRKRIVGILHGVTSKDLAADEKTPVVLKRIDLLDINKIDSYFAQLRDRAKVVENTDA